MFKIIVAYEKNRGIGLNNELPWHIPGELRWVSETTTKVADQSKRNALLMGRKTWESIPENLRPLKNRLNMVVSHTLKEDRPGLLIFPTFEEAVEYVNTNSKSIETCFVFGGATIYKQAFEKNIVDEILATEVDESYLASTFFPPIPKNFSVQSVEEVVFPSSLKIKHVVYKKMRN